MPHSDHSPSPNPQDSTTPLPAFPSNIPTAPLLRISLTKLLAHDTLEESRCWAACQSLGFFYLSLDGTAGSSLLSSSAELFTLMPRFFDLPLQEKEKYDFKDRGSYMGYKGFGKGFVDAKGGRDGNEFFNVGKDAVMDVVGAGDEEKLPVPACLDGEAERRVLRGFVERGHAVCAVVLRLLQQRLQLTARVRGEGGLLGKHRLRARSGDQVRFVRAPPQHVGAERVSLGEHTDFGSVTVLFNRLGGLQVRLPEGMQPETPLSANNTDPSENGIQHELPTSEREMQLCQDGWCYVRPLPGHCIINLGDALVKFSDGLLRSNIHRVVAPPGAQKEAVRWSLVYFSRPEDDVVLKSLVGSEEEGVDKEEEVTAKEWILRRALGRREKDGWEKSAGTEEGSMRRGGMRV
ncbi:hypothetical protein SVAN01_10111 [Stagonosporopsis vannaccii]|nr:hypothetical protein SVAN01_10111 [Stagonosporopsis vannaccii]